MTGSAVRGSLRQAIGAAASVEILTRIAMLAVTIFSGRLLGPAEIGTLGVVIAGIAIVSMLGHYVESGSLVASNALDDRLRAGAGLALRLAVVGLPLVVSILFRDPLLAPFLRDDARRIQGGRLLTILAALPVLEAISGVPVVFLQRRMQLSSVVVRQSLQPLLYAAMGLPLLAFGFGTTGLAWAQVTGAAVVCASLWWVVAREGGLRLMADGASFFAVARESAKQATAGLVGFLTERVDNLLVGATLGPAALGFYSFAWSSSRLPITVLSRICRSAFLPALVASDGDVERNRVILRRGLAAALGASVGVAGLIGLYGGETVVFVMGERWSAAGRCLELMSLTVAVSPLLFLALSALQAGGDAHRGGPVAAGLQLGCQLALIPPLCARFGETGAAFVDFLAFSIAAAVVAWWTRRFGTPGFFEIIRMLEAPALGLMCFVPALALLAPTPSNLVTLTVAVVGGGLLYFFGFAILGKGLAEFRLRESGV